MNLEAIRTELEGVVTAVRAEASAETWVVRGAGIGEGTPGRVSFEKSLNAIVLGDVLGAAQKLLDKEFVPYDPSYQASSGQVLVDELAALPELQPLHEALSGATADDPERGEVRATVHRASSSPRQAVTAYRTKGAGIAIRKARVLLPRNGVYEQAPEGLLLYEPSFDAIVVGDHAFISRITTFRTFGSTEKASRMARATFERATAKIEIEGAEELLAAVSSDPNMVAKMAQLTRTLEAEPAYAEVLTTKNLLAFLDANPQIAIATAGEGDARKLVFESSPQKRWLIVKALADDFLRSDLSHRSYEVGSKSPITS